MEMTNTDDTVTESITVDAPRERAFYAFAQQMTSWWPREYTWSDRNFGHIVLEPEEGSRWYEVDRSGAEQPDWGRLIAWQPPERLVLSWMIGARRQPETDPSHASEVEIRFSDAGEGTRVEVEHRGFSRHGEAWEAYRQGMASGDGWPKILSAYSDYADQQREQFGIMQEQPRAG